jgi:flagellar biogenesis protein FliO
MREETRKRMEPVVPNPITTSIKVLLGLALIIGLIYLVCLILKRIQESRAAVFGKPVLELVSTINLGLGPGRSLHVVRVADRFFVITATSAKITLLAELDKSIEEMKVENEPQETDVAKGQGFHELLAAYTQKFVRSSQIPGGLEGHKDER